MRAVALPPPAFRHPSDQLLAMALSAGPGPLPLGPDVGRGFLRALEDPVEALPTDPAGVRELKRRVAEARETLAGEVRAGRRVRDALEEYQRGRERAADVRLAAVREAGALLEAEGAEAARRFAARANETLRAHGVPEIPVPGGHGPAAHNALVDAARARGVGPVTLATYRTACEEGWAPAPTSGEQRAIWERVHAVPDRPLTIEYDPRRDR